MSTKSGYKNYKIFSAEKDLRDQVVSPLAPAVSYSLFEDLRNELIPCIHKWGN